MRFPWQNNDNPNFNHNDFKVSPHFEPYQRVILTLCFIILAPIALVIYPIYKLIMGSLVAAAQITFYIGPKFFKGHKKSAPHSRWQFMRSYINTKASRLCHINCALRKILYRMSGMKIGKGVFIGGFGVMDDVWPQNVIVEDKATISFDVTIIAHGPKPNKGDVSNKMVIFRENSYVGAGCTILPGVEIGSYAIVGSGSVVTKSVPAGAVVGGAPARLLYYREGFGPDAEKKDE